MAVKAWPVEMSADAENWSLQFNTQSFTSDLNGAEQTAELPGARWSVTRTYSNRQGVSARRLQGFLAGMKGSHGRVYVTPVDWEPLGSPTGTPTVSAAQTAGASTLSTTGWTASVSGLFLTGDYFEINGELKKLTSDASSDASGNATIEFSPPLRISATVGMQIRYNEPRCIMKLVDDGQASWSMNAPVIYATNIELVEALDI